MKYFGSRSDFAVEIGDTIENAHFVLRFYLGDVWLNPNDDHAYAPMAAAWFPSFDEPVSDMWGMDVFWEVPFAAKPHQLIERMYADDHLREAHRSFNFGPVTDDFTILACARPSDVVLLGVRNDCGQGIGDLANLRETISLKWGTIHWTAVTLQKAQFLSIVREARAAILSLVNS